MRHYISFVLLAVLLGGFVDVCHAASGSVTLDQSGAVSWAYGNVVVNWQAIVDVDDTPSGAGPEPKCINPNYDNLLVPYYWSLTWWTATYADVCVEVDGNLLECHGVNDLETPLTEPFTVQAAHFEPGTSHNLRVFLQDVYGAYCSYGSGYYDPISVDGSIISQDSLTFTFCKNDDPCCGNPLCGQTCPVEGNTGE